MRTLMRATLAMLLAAAAACGGDSGTGPGPNGGPPDLANGTMTAKVNGQPWRATFIVQATVASNPTGQISLVQISGSDTVGVPLTRARQITITMALGAPPAVGTWPMQLGLAGFPGYNAAGQLNQAASIWNTLPGGGAAAGSGSFTIATITATRITGSFAFTANAAGSNPASERGAVNVTEGQFDIAITQNP